MIPQLIPFVNNGGLLNKSGEVDYGDLINDSKAQEFLSTLCKRSDAVIDRNREDEVRTIQGRFERFWVELLDNEANPRGYTSWYHIITGEKLYYHPNSNAHWDQGGQSLVYTASRSERLHVDEPPMERPLLKRSRQVYMGDEQVDDLVEEVMTEPLPLSQKKNQ